jgi:solute carrier family 25 (peroxisomal adenine nucleotide transporter), member 17
LGAAFSNTAATSLLYPLILAKTRLQVHKKRSKQDANPTSRKEKAENMINIWGEIIRKEGVRGLYQGLEAQVTKGFVSEGVKMMVKQR